MGGVFNKCVLIVLTLIAGSVESSNTWIMIRSDGHESPHAAPMESWYTCVEPQEKKQKIKISETQKKSEPKDIGADL